MMHEKQMLLKAIQKYDSALYDKSLPGYAPSFKRSLATFSEIQNDEAKYRRPIY